MANGLNLLIATVTLVVKCYLVHPVLQPLLMCVEFLLLYPRDITGPDKKWCENLPTKSF